MSYRREPMTAEEQLADLIERVRRTETALAAVPARLLKDNPTWLPSGTHGAVLAWDGPTGEWVAVAPGAVGQRLVRSNTARGGVHWVT